MKRRTALNTSIRPLCAGMLLYCSRSFFCARRILRDGFPTRPSGHPPVRPGGSSDTTRVSSFLRWRAARQHIVLTTARAAWRGRHAAQSRGIARRHTIVPLTIARWRRIRRSPARSATTRSRFRAITQLTASGTSLPVHSSAGVGSIGSRRGRESEAGQLIIHRAVGTTALVARTAPARAGINSIHSVQRQRPGGDRSRRRSGAPHIGAFGIHGSCEGRQVRLIPRHQGAHADRADVPTSLKRRSRLRASAVGSSHRPHTARDRQATNARKPSSAVTPECGHTHRDRSTS